MSYSNLQPPRVSVLLPVYNGGAALDHALESLNRQTLTAWECMAVDDGSDDDTPRRLAAWAERDARIRPVRLARSGIVAALRAGFAASTPTSPYIARMDADDWSHPQRLERQTAFLDNQPEIGLASCRVGFGGDRSAAGGFARHVDWLNSLLEPDAISLGRFRDAPLAHPTVFFRRSLVERYGFYADGDFPEDYELWLRWLEAGVAMTKLPEELLIWNDPPGRLTRVHANYSRDAFARVRARYLARWLAHNNARHPVVWVWGAGKVSRRQAFLLLEHGIRIQALVDIDPRKIGNRVQSIPVISRDDLPPPGHAFILVFLSAQGAPEEAEDRLLSSGHMHGRDYLLCC